MYTSHSCIYTCFNLDICYIYYIHTNDILKNPGLLNCIHKKHTTDVYVRHEYGSVARGIMWTSWTYMFSFNLFKKKMKSYMLDYIFY